MKKLILLLAMFVLFSCNNDDDLITPPEPEPIIANAKVLFNGTCGDDHYFIEIDEVPLDSLPVPIRLPFYTFFNWPEEYRVENLEVFVDYRNSTIDEARACNTIGPTPHRFVAREILLPTE